MEPCTKAHKTPHKEITGLSALVIYDESTASLSVRGALCVGGRFRSDLLAVTHPPSKRSVAIARKANIFHSFVRACGLFVAQESCDVLWHAQIKAVLAGSTGLAQNETRPSAAAALRRCASPVGLTCSRAARGGGSSNVSQFICIRVA
eukprot:gnl/Chilomastix_cuspidata/4364.p2 GENE.gnl/Chilomastix_cuspidata/4364~~gnl/Chilomastix_cuspidata/4364.p2  ORF type:complete len:148 (-),score=17.57 gnl/Chilomastix_cuspidata/4364:576-1019(-)